MAGESPVHGIRVVIRVEAGEAAEALRASIAPDNATAPSWLRIEERVEDGALVVEVSTTDAARAKSLRNTVDEIVAFLYAMLKTLEEVAKAKTPGAAR